MFLWVFSILKNDLTINHTLIATSCLQYCQLTSLRNLHTKLRPYPSYSLLSQIGFAMTLSLDCCLQNFLMLLLIHYFATAHRLVSLVVIASWLGPFCLGVIVSWLGPFCLVVQLSNPFILTNLLQTIYLFCSISWLIKNTFYGGEMYVPNNSIILLW